MQHEGTHDAPVVATQVGSLRSHQYCLIGGVGCAYAQRVHLVGHEVQYTKELHPPLRKVADIPKPLAVVHHLFLAVADGLIAEGIPLLVDDPFAHDQRGGLLADVATCEGAFGAVVGLAVERWVDADDVHLAAQ